MARAWPHIVRLRLGHGRNKEEWSWTNRQPQVPLDIGRPTARALVALADSCAKLVRLQCDVAHTTSEDDRALRELCSIRGWSGEHRGELVVIDTRRIANLRHDGLIP